MFFSIKCRNPPSVKTWIREKIEILVLNEKPEVAKEKNMYCFIKDLFYLSKTHAGKLTRVKNNLPNL